MLSTDTVWKNDSVVKNELPSGELGAAWPLNAYWDASASSDSGIPVLYGVDAVHGNNNVAGSTVFPHNIGLGATGDPELVERIARATALEVLAAGVDWTFAPTLAVARDPHWGRTYESFGGSAGCVSRFSGPAVRGLQADLGEDGVLACAKHWVGDGGTAHGIDQGETTLPWDVLRDVHIAPYLPALDAGVQTVMVSFNSWNGDKCHGHTHLITEVLKGDLGFAGFVISDWDGIDYLADDYAEAIARAINAGIDMFMVSENWRDFLKHLKAHVVSGRVAQARLDDAVRQILGVKERYGLFGKPRPSARRCSGASAFGCAAHRDIAREAVRKSLVLLKDSAVLPLKRDARLLVTGRLADDVGAQCGGFTIAWQGQRGDVPGGTSIFGGLQMLAASAELAPAGATAQPGRHDAAVVVIGEEPYAEGFGDIRETDDVLIRTGSMVRGTIKELAPYGRSLKLSDLHPEGLAAIRAAGAAGVPVITVLISGRPLNVDAELHGSHAFVAAWLPGSEGDGVAEVLFGRQPFTGSLPVPWPRVRG